MCVGECENSGCAAAAAAGDTELIESLLFDAEATRGALANWMKENMDGKQNQDVSRR